MKSIYKIAFTTLLMISFLITCEEDSLPEVELPLAGTYTLTDMTINVEASTLRDTLVYFITAQNGVDSIQIDSGTLVLSGTTNYSNQDSIPITGTICLHNDASASLGGDLPVNVGSGCLPNITILNFNSDGTWLADTTNGTFAIDLVFDALDINGTYVLLGDQIEISYDIVEENDERMIYSINYLGTEATIIPMCIPVASITERIMTLTLN